MKMEMMMNPFEILKNAGAIKQQLEKTQEELDSVVETGSAGGAMVKVTINGKFEMLKVEIDPLTVDPKETQMLQDLIVAAYNQAASKIQESLKDKVSSLTGGMNIPGFNF
ncbi:MAG TPA: YbaB/EbfC family nucleoid-associated protein [Treponemataceae bacterium]|jgi:DNA-binding YbaB/EbfC family protein|nr:YbaB/EbfC family nucleoid-associated protein [Treponemataceae bacterium]HOQ93383.1 YbaB/EbfC family nucleoid-associated protein [Treponemataceae bacterium]HPM06540.1 YbaB/EbfC family nucleoid-associated protein [Treponemataceae bacterium]HPY53572.1 YbaB/EbfC family nucleoid-associated protein [Treponemataceae bacterium]